MNFHADTLAVHLGLLNENICVGACVGKESLKLFLVVGKHHEFFFRAAFSALEQIVFGGGDDGVALAMLEYLLDEIEFTNNGEERFNRGQIIGNDGFA